MLLSSTETFRSLSAPFGLLLFAVTTSGAESPLKSPMATEPGCEPTAKVVWLLKFPEPSPNSTDILSSFWLATARSNAESPFKSSRATERGLFPTAKVVWLLKLPERVRPQFTTVKRESGSHIG